MTGTNSKGMNVWQRFVSVPLMSGKEGVRTRGETQSGCNTCNAAPIHIECGRLNPKNIDYYCEVCAPADEGDSEDEAEEEKGEFEEEEESVMDVENKVGGSNWITFVCHRDGTSDKTSRKNKVGGKTHKGGATNHLFWYQAGNSHSQAALRSSP